MSLLAPRSTHRPRELRRRVITPARLRDGVDWSDACILNISSRGLLIQSDRPAVAGSTVVVLHRNHLIVARVMWSAAGRSGLQTDNRLPVEEILSLAQARSLRLIASHGVIHDRRRETRGSAEVAQLRGRMLEYLAVGAIAFVLAVGIWAMAQRALLAPLSIVSAALGNKSGVTTST